MAEKKDPGKLVAVLLRRKLGNLLGQDRKIFLGYFSQQQIIRADVQRGCFLRAEILLKLKLEPE